MRLLRLTEHGVEGRDPSERTASETLREAGAAAERALDQRPAESFPSARLDRLAGVYRQTRNWPWLRAHLERLKPADYLNRNYTLAADLVRDGHGGWIAKQMEASPFKSDSMEYADLAAGLASNGQAEWVVRNIPFPDPKYVSRNEQDMLVALCRYGQADVVRDYVTRGLAEDIGSMSRVTLATVLIRGGELRTAVSLIKKFPEETIREYGHVIASTLIQHGYPEPAIPMLDMMKMPNLPDRERSKWHKHFLSSLSALRDRPDARSWLERQPDYTPDAAPPNPDPRTLMFGARDVQDAKEVFNASNKKANDAFRVKLETALWTGGVPDEERQEAKRALSRSTERWSPEERSIAERVIDGTGVLSPGFTQLLEFMEGRRPECVVEVHKTGSALLVYGRRNPETHVREFTFVNDISATSAHAWEQARDVGIPVAPILRPPVERNDGSVRVYSRYCGRPISWYLEEGRIPRSFRLWIEAEATKTRDELLRRGIRHGHPHQGNFTVEFYRSELFDQETTAGKTANEIPYAPGDVIFDPIPYFENPAKWMPVVRLIDWDQATSSHS